MINQKLRKALQGAGFNQAELSRKSDLDPAVISLAINGKLLLRADQKQKISQALGLPIREIFPFEDDKVL